jgi:hypothetical protein
MNEKCAVGGAAVVLLNALLGKHSDGQMILQQRPVLKKTVPELAKPGLS